MDSSSKLDLKAFLHMRSPVDSRAFFAYLCKERHLTLCFWDLGKPIRPTAPQEGCFFVAHFYSKSFSIRTMQQVTPIFCLIAQRTSSSTSACLGYELTAQCHQREMAIARSPSPPGNPPFHPSMFDQIPRSQGLCRNQSRTTVSEKHDVCMPLRVTTRRRAMDM